MYVCVSILLSVSVCECNWSFINVKLQVNNLAQFVRGAWPSPKKQNQQQEQPQFVVLNYLFMVLLIGW